jgi:hypothetical protein
MSSGLVVQKVDNSIKKVNEHLFRLIEELASYGFDVTVILVTPESLVKYAKAATGYDNSPFIMNMENHPIMYELRTARGNISIGVKP